MITKILTKAKKLRKKIGHQKSNDLEITLLDPLGLDNAVKDIPQLNREKNTKSLTNLLYSILPSPEQLNNFSYNEAIAAMRDIGLILGSLKRHGVEPVEVVPELDYVLGELSEKTNMPPRDTLLHYTQWNPVGERMRRYTDYQDEEYLIKGVQLAIHPLMKAIELLMELHQTSPFSPQYGALCKQAGVEFRQVVNGVVLAKRKVSPQVFAEELRFYFDPITLYNRQFIGPGAVEMPMFVFDHLLWSSDIENEDYYEFKNTYLPFILPELRLVYRDFNHAPSLISRMLTELKNDGSNPALLMSARELHKLSRLQISFRMPHKKMAKEAYNHANKMDKGHSKGSGGYSPTVLSEILDLNMTRIDALYNAVIESNSN